jgi:hypothetical protein
MQQMERIGLSTIISTIDNTAIIHFYLAGLARSANKAARWRALLRGMA